MKLKPSGLGLKQPQQAAQQRGFAGPILAQETPELTRSDGQIDAGEDGLRAVAEGQVVCTENNLRAFHAYAIPWCSGCWQSRQLRHRCQFSAWLAARTTAPASTSRLSELLFGKQPAGGNQQPRLRPSSKNTRPLLCRRNPQHRLLTARARAALSRTTSVMLVSHKTQSKRRQCCQQKRGSQAMDGTRQRQSDPDLVKPQP